MTFFTALYTLLIRPLELLFEVIYVYANRVINHPGFSIIVLSLAMNFLVLPLYRQADAMQQEERDVELKLQKWVDHIKRTFSGDKRYMILQEYYRQNHYKPAYALRGSLSLLLEIPFFIAAYRFLSSLELLQGVSFGPIGNLGAPDGLIRIGGMHINLLPVLMTLINVVSGAVYTKGMPRKAKIQLYAMALVFLIFLYQSPSGLVFYWTLNNLFSLAKNIFYKFKNPKRALFILASLAGLALLYVFGFVYPSEKIKRKLFFIGCGVLMQLPIIIDLITKSKPVIKDENSLRADHVLFVLAAVLNTILVGLLIPSAVIDSSPGEFIDAEKLTNPLSYLLHSGFLAFGSFVVWAGLFYYLLRKKGKYLFSKLYFALSCTFLFNYMVYGKGQSNLSGALQYERVPIFTRSEQLINLLAVCAILALIYLMATRAPKIARLVCASAAVAVLGMSALNIVNINRTIRSDISNIRRGTDLANEMMENGLIRLNRDGKNVVVIMLDRAMGPYIPYIFDEKPELAEKFDGFTYYHNTISFGPTTVSGAPAMMAGYEYTPAAINARPDETFRDKYNESSRLMAYLFDDNGFDVTICNPPLAGLQYLPDLSIYDERPNIKTFMINKRIKLLATAPTKSDEAARKRNFFCFGITKVAPLLMQSSLYNEGLYNEANGSGNKVQVTQSVSEAAGLSTSFMNEYSIMSHLTDFTKVSDDSRNTFFFICNEMTHDAMLLQKPDYVPSESVDNRAYDDDIESRYVINGVHMRLNTATRAAHYDSNMSAMLLLANWLDYLREEGVYDNTRIILVSDHANDKGQFDELIIDDDFDAQVAAALLMVKDINASGFTVSEEFMTNADTPLLAMSGLIEDPVNPFTGIPLTDEEKYAHEQLFYNSKVQMPEFRDDNVYPAGDWYALDGDLWDVSAWHRVEK